MALFAAAIVLLGAVIVGALDRPDRDVIGYNVLSERVFKGIVASEGHIIEDRPTLMDPERRIRFFDECALIK